MDVHLAAAGDVVVDDPAATGFEDDDPPHPRDALQPSQRLGQRGGGRHRALDRLVELRNLFVEPGDVLGGLAIEVGTTGTTETLEDRAGLNRSGFLGGSVS